MTTTKRKVLVFLVEALETVDESLSAQVKAALRGETERRRRRQLLAELLDRLDAEGGSLSTALVEKYVGLLG